MNCNKKTGSDICEPYPNMGWAKVYVDAERDIPKAWQNDFIDELTSDDVDYKHALERSVRLFGVRWV